MERIVRLFGVFFVVILLLAPSFAFSQDFEINNFTLISKERVSRVEYDYTYEADITNSGPDAQDVIATVTSNSPYTLIIDGEINFGDVAAGSTITCSDTFTIRQNRRYPFNWSDLNWDVLYDLSVDNTRTVDAEGGIFEFPNGVILEIPQGAVSQPTLISIYGLPCEQVDAILSAQNYRIYEERCIGAFSSKPDGLKFNLPIKATVPVLQLETNEIPVIIEIDSDELRYWITKTNLTYMPDLQLAEIELERFPLSDIAIDALSGIRPEVTEELCTDPFWNQKLDICEDFDPLQPAICLLLPEERPVGTICCREKSFTSVTEAIDWSDNRSSGDCEILSDGVTVIYHECTLPDGSTAAPEAYTLGGISPFCPEDMTFEINVQDSIVNLLACEKETLSATITGYEADGTVLIPPETFPAKWTSLAPEIAFVDHSGVVKGLKEGVAQVVAGAGVEDPRITPGQAIVNVRDIKSFSITPAQAVIGVCDGRILDAEIVDSEGQLLDATNVTWLSKDSNIAYVIPETGPWTSVQGMEPGVVKIEATFNEGCETKKATAKISVDGNGLDGSLWLIEYTVTGGICGIGNQSTDYVMIYTDCNTIYIGGCGGTISDRSFSCYHPVVLFSDTGTFSYDWNSYTGTAIGRSSGGVCTYNTKGTRIQSP
jgi:hypothetical protein